MPVLIIAGTVLLLAAAAGMVLRVLGLRTRWLGPAPLQLVAAGLGAVLIAVPLAIEQSVQAQRAVLMTEIERNVDAIASFEQQQAAEQERIASIKDLAARHAALIERHLHGLFVPRDDLEEARYTVDAAPAAIERVEGAIRLLGEEIGSARRRIGELAASLAALGQR